MKKDYRKLLTDNGVRQSRDFNTWDFVGRVRSELESLDSANTNWLNLELTYQNHIQPDEDDLYHEVVDRLPPSDLVGTPLESINYYLDRGLYPPQKSLSPLD